MARFRGTVQGARGEASRLGHRSLEVSANGWNIGIDVDARGSNSNDKDLFEVTLTGGSNGSQIRVIGFASIEDGVPQFRIADSILRGMGLDPAKVAPINGQEPRIREASNG